MYHIKYILFQSKDADQETREFAQTHSIGLKALKSTFSGIIFFLSQALKLNMAAINVRQDLVSFGMILWISRTSNTAPYRVQICFLVFVDKRNWFFSYHYGHLHINNAFVNAPYVERK